MRRLILSLTLFLASGAAGAATAQDASAGAVMRETDRAMSCEQLVAEGAAISATLAENNGGPSLLGQIGGVMRTGTSILVPGAGLAFAGADALTQDEREAKLAEDLARMNRWHWLNGLWFGRGCDGAAGG